VLLSQLCRGAVDFGRPADVALYHLGCFQLQCLDGRRVPLAAVVLYSLQQQRPHFSMDQVLEVFRAAGAVLIVTAPKCKQDAGKRKRNGGQCIDWLQLRKHILPPELAVLCPTRTLAFCMAATWWAKGAVSARLLTVRKANSSGRAAPKRHQQPDFQATSTGYWKVPTSGDLNSSPGYNSAHLVRHSCNRSINVASSVSRLDVLRACCTAYATPLTQPLRALHD